MNKTSNTIFKLTEIEYLEFYDEENDETFAPQYPNFNVEQSPVGLFSTLAKAEQAIQERIEFKKRNRWKYAPFGFLIDEFELDEISFLSAKSRRNYLSEGSLLDECLISEIMGEKFPDLEEFSGRPADKVRFRNGDLVEVLHRDTVTLNIVCNPPWSPEKANESKKRYTKAGYDDLHFDYSDDCYYTLGVSESDDDDDTHGHPSPVRMFPLRFPVSDELRNNLEKQYRI